MSQELHLEQPLLTPAEMAKLLRVKETTLYTWAYRRQIPSQKVGNLLRFDREAIERWLRTQERMVK